MRLSRIGFFTLVLHRDFPLERVSQVYVKLYSSGVICVVFLVGESESELEKTLGQPGKAVGVDLGIARLVTLSDRWPLPWEP
ncbi:hypothetical protein B9Q04_08700 [Candidatus Marsarchaeota G2 archaeon BE_D]|uniref:Uncharacterized protein n=3 Tax=Candidatus Marsarchaeota group 2 TaxID=2203771 RepID=A0A2R6CAE6_9ARCH|nr:MAG: hypothetical protein B9Q07_04860 [Candidatus Marsarchaeota G2 archaeon ECH_B_3]PSO02240.1 MAG: hypothetical protein B9Q05_05980 [Candidatus Marsarchaeota G2 archaeon ECH_B_1]PSO07851.1 MAG: hypothetical protein B9Q04_08700 [Candidatus Marsarchaeota G2 archaeon BE_D]